MTLEEVAGQGAVCVATEPQWIAWGPDSPGYPKCPVSPGADCEVQFLDGSMQRDKTPQMWTWHHISYGDHDIIAYRIHPAKDDARALLVEVATAWRERQSDDFLARIDAYLERNP